MRDRIDLNGWWDWRLPGGAPQKRAVPSCYLCVGEARYSREFYMQELGGKRAVLHFEGVHYTGTVSVNGRFTGEMLPYVFYEFDVTDFVTPGANTVEVTVKDINADFGPTNGWEDYGGISRDVWMETRDPVGVYDTQWITRMKNGYASAEAELRVFIYNKTGGSVKTCVSAVLSHTGAAAVKTETNINLAEGGGECVLRFDLDNVLSWSPSFPNLYGLKIIVSSGETMDSVTLEVGFREFIAKGESFYLNGEKIFLKGVARHDMWGDAQGFCLTDGQIERDLALVKETGANFIRLVHYPHSRHTVDCAARIGLMVSEEPGLWWSDVNDEFMKKCALEIMERTVLRDRSNPAVIAWLFFNECVLTDAGDYLKRGAALCRSLDPTRLLSGASCMENAVTKRVFDETGMDFYTQHPYCHEGEKILEAAEGLRGKPLVLTEWGGWFIHYNPNLIKQTKKIIAKLAHNPEGEPRISGMCWWQWQDIRQYSRGLPGCEDGVLSDGLVTEGRVRKQTYAVMAEFFDLVEHRPEPFFEIEEYSAAFCPELTPVDLSAFYGPVNDSLWREAANKKNKKQHPKTPNSGISETGIYIQKEIVSLSGFRCAIPAGHPLILRGERRKIEIPINAAAERVYLFGAATYFDGYPVRGEYGAAAMRITLAYSDGSITEFEMRHGLEISSASLIARCSRVDARAANAPRVAKITLDPDWEVYAVNLFAMPADETKTITRVFAESVDDAFDPVIFAVSYL